MWALFLKFMIEFEIMMIEFQIEFRFQIVSNRVQSSVVDAQR